MPITENELLTTTDNSDNYLQSRNEIDKVAEVLKEHRKTFEEKKTPEQHKGKLPMDGRMMDYVKAPYMINLMKEFCKERYNITITETKDVSMPTSTTPEHWIRITIGVLDRSTNNSYTGIGAARVRTNKENKIINYRHDCEAALTFALKSVSKNMGIAADIYGRDIEEYSEETQKIIDEILPVIRKRYGVDDYERFLVKMETFGSNEDELVEYINKLKASWEVKK